MEPWPGRDDGRFRGRRELPVEAPGLLRGVALLELVDAAGGVQHAVLAGVERVRRQEMSAFDGGYSLPSSHLIVSLLPRVERVRLEVRVTSRNTTSWYAGWMSAFMAAPEQSGKAEGIVGAGAGQGKSTDPGLQETASAALTRASNAAWS